MWHNFLTESLSYRPVLTIDTATIISLTYPIHFKRLLIKYLMFSAILITQPSTQRSSRFLEIIKLTLFLISKGFIRFHVFASILFSSSMYMSLSFLDRQNVTEIDVNLHSNYKSMVYFPKLLFGFSVILHTLKHFISKPSPYISFLALIVDKSSHLLILSRVVGQSRFKIWLWNVFWRNMLSHIPWDVFYYLKLSWMLSIK